MSRALRIALAVVCAVVLAALATYAWRGWYARYVTDDYCTASQLRTMGFFEAMQYQRRVWSGRFAYFPIKAALEAIGPITVRFTPSVLLALLVTGTAWSMRRLLTPAARLVTIAGALVLAYALIDSSPSLTNIGSAFYWETGAITYVLPLVLFTFWTGLFGLQRSLVFCCAMSGLLLLIAGGLSETSLAAQGAMAGGIFLIALFLGNRRAAWIAGCGIVATLLALTIMAVAPGTMVRAAAHAVPAGPLTAMARMFELSYRFLGVYVFVGGAALLLAIVMGVIAGMSARDGSPRLTAYATIVALCAYVVSFLPAAWLIPSGPPERALDVPNFFLIAALFSAGAGLGRRVGEQRSIAVAAAALLLCAIPLWSIAANARAIPDLTRNAARIDTMDRFLRAHRGEDVTLPASWALHTGFLDDDPRFWTNQCVSSYYGLQSLRVVRTKAKSR